MIVRVLYTVQGIWSVLHYDATRKTLKTYGSCYGRRRSTMEYHPELNGKEKKHVEATSYCTG